jgi:CubicO group peptidase (beta-lactamase class C family)
MLKQVTKPLAREPGSGFAYSNLGYTLVGAMIERVGEKSWEELIVSACSSRSGSPAPA